jgi:hypothetical protein
MGVYELSGAGSLKTARTVYSSMNAGNQYGAMVPIASVSPTSAYPLFANVPQIYQDLFIVVYGRSTSSAATSPLYLQFATGNGSLDTGSNYSTTLLSGDGSAASSTRQTSQTLIQAGTITAATSTSGIFASASIQILNYSNSSTFKTTLSRFANDLNGSGTTGLNVGLWRNTGAITSISVQINGNYESGTTVTLYGIRAVSS